VPLHSSASTLLKISGVGMSPYAARGLTQTLTVINETPDMRRTINGELVDFSYEQFRKYSSTISGNDQQPPGVGGIWPGMQVDVECIAELCFVTAEGAAERTVVGGSSRVEGIYTFYRPVLVMLITGFDQSFDEYSAQVQWSLKLEEK
jgi:hypothetical protein